MGKKSPSKNAFTLIEVMVAMIILAVLILGGAFSMSSTGVSLIRQRYYRDAVMVASSIMDDTVYRYDIAQLDAWGNSGSHLVTNLTINGNTYSARTDFTSTTESGENYVHVLVKVTSTKTDSVTMAFEGLVD